mgnify:CR=1 FL=1
MNLIDVQRLGEVLGALAQPDLILPLKAFQIDDDRSAVRTHLAVKRIGVGLIENIAGRIFNPVFIQLTFF